MMMRIYGSKKIKSIAAALLTICGLSASLPAQTVRPLINELKNPAKGEVEYVNDSLTPLNVVLEMKSECERCSTELPPQSHEAMICSYECTFCTRCSADQLGGICPNCAGELLRRPARQLK